MMSCPVMLIKPVMRRADSHSSNTPSTAGRRAVRADHNSTALTPRQQEVLRLLGTGLSSREIAEHLSVSWRTIAEHCLELRERLDIATTTQLRVHARLVATGEGDGVLAAGTTASGNLLRRQSRYLPHAALNVHGVYGVQCRTVPYDLRFLRDAADYVIDLATIPGERPDNVEDVFRQQGGTLGAKQALIAALAHECGQREIQLTVACGELAVSSAPGLEELFLHRDTVTLPLAICCLRYRRQRLQLSDTGSGSHMMAPPHSETVVNPATLVEHRESLYREFAADWCRVFDWRPEEFARLRAHVLQGAPTAAVCEDLLGYVLGLDFQPTL